MQVCTHHLLAGLQAVKYSFITSIHVYTPIYINTFTVTVLKLPISLEWIVQTVTCRLKCQN